MSGAKKSIALLGLFCLCAATAPARGAALAAFAPGPAQTGDLSKVIAELNAASAKFKSAQADFTWDTYQAVVQVHDTQTGVIYYQRNGSTTRMALDFQPAGGQTAGKEVVFNGNQLEYYQPTIKQMDVYHAGASGSQYDSFLTLGFGASGSALEKDWDVTLLGRQTIDGIDTVELDLKPKDPKIQSNFTHVTIWVDPSRSVTLKQIFYEPSGDLRTCTYRNIKYNQPVGESVFHLKLARGTAIQNH